MVERQDRSLTKTNVMKTRSKFPNQQIKLALISAAAAALIGCRGGPFPLPGPPPELPVPPVLGLKNHPGLQVVATADLARPRDILSAPEAPRD
jgi:hypothetical protein